MRRKSFMWIFAILFVAAFAGLTVFINSRNTATTEAAIQKEYEVSQQTIKYELTGAGELQTSETKYVYLSTSKKFKLACVESQDIVAEGEPLVQYTDGTYLKAPFDCVVTDMNLPTPKSKAGENNYVTVVAIDQLVLDMNISEADIEQVSLGQKVTITPNMDESVTYEGYISYISGVATRSNGYNNFSANVTFENDGQLKVGMSANCSILLKEAVDVAVVPVEAVYEESGSYYVNVKKDTTTEKREVTVGLSNADVVEITSGLEVGETVVYEVK